MELQQKTPSVSHQHEVVESEDQGPQNQGPHPKRKILLRGARIRILEGILIFEASTLKGLPGQ